MLVTKKEYLNAIKEDRKVTKYDSFLYECLPLCIKRKDDRRTNKKYIENMEKLERIIYIYINYF